MKTNEYTTIQNVCQRLYGMWTFVRRQLTVHGVVESGQFSIPLVAISSEPLKIRPELS